MLSRSLIKSSSIRNLKEYRRYLKVGEKIPINFMKDSTPPTIQEDKKYPEWVFTLGDKLPSKAQVLRRIDKFGLKDFTIPELKRTKRLMTREVIKKNNMAASEDD